MSDLPETKVMSTAGTDGLHKREQETVGPDGSVTVKYPNGNNFVLIEWVIPGSYTLHLPYYTSPIAQMPMA